MSPPINGRQGPSEEPAEEGVLLALAERCESRASELSDEAELCEIEADALHRQEAARWEEYKNGVGMAATIRWRTFHARLSELQRNAKATREDVEHYLECAAALRARAQSGAAS